MDGMTTLSREIESKPRYCTPCAMSGKSNVATRVANGVPKCEACFNTLKAVAKEANKVSEQPAASGFCHCGRPANHRGMHKGGKMKAKLSSQPVRAAAKVAKRPRADSSMIAAHAELIAKRDSINQLIKLMEEVYGL